MVAKYEFRLSIPDHAASKLEVRRHALPRPVLSPSSRTHAALWPKAHLSQSVTRAAVAPYARPNIKASPSRRDAPCVWQVSSSRAWANAFSRSRWSRRSAAAPAWRESARRREGRTRVFAERAEDGRVCGDGAACLRRHSLLFCVVCAVGLLLSICADSLIACIPYLHSSYMPFLIFIDR